ncbi:MAG: hypothetical protein R2818_00805 [Flavobacteriales bacterium]
MEHPSTPPPQDHQPLLELIAEFHGLVQRMSAVLMAVHPLPVPPGPTTATPTDGLDLSPRMREYLRLHAHPKDYTYKEIAAKMKVSTSNLRKWRDRIRDRYGPDGKTALALWVRENGLG